MVSGHKREFASSILKRAWKMLSCTEYMIGRCFACPLRSCLHEKAGCVEVHGALPVALHEVYYQQAVFVWVSALQEALSRPACRDKGKKALQAELLPFSHHCSTASPAAMPLSRMLPDMCAYKCKKLTPHLDAET